MMQRKSKDVDEQNAKRLSASVLLPGDRILVQKMSERGEAGKLKSFWKTESILC